MDAKYQDLISRSVEFFGAFKDEDFFSSKVSHIYYNGVVSREKAQLFREQFLMLNETTYTKENMREVPKPIVIHLSSGGGDILGIDIFETLIFQARVPFCVVIEDICASAATFLALYAPYRVMIDYSQYLIHDSAGFEYGKTGNSVVKQKYALDMFIRYKNLLKSRTRLTDDEITDYINRDKMIVAADCLKKRIVDRVLHFPEIGKYDIGSAKSGNLSLPLNTFLKKTNFNVITVDLYNMKIASNDSVGAIQTQNPIPFSAIQSLETFIFSLDSMILSNIHMKQIKPVVLQILPLYSYTEAFISPIVHAGLLYRLALIQHLGVPLVAYCEGQQNLSNLFLSLMCPNRIALKPYSITTEFTYRGVEGAWKFIDQIYNTRIFMNELKRFGKCFSKLPNAFYEKLDKAIIHISPQEQIQYGLIHHIMDSHPTQISNKNVRAYLKMNHFGKIETTKKKKKQTPKRKKKEGNVHLARLTSSQQRVAGNRHQNTQK